MQERISTESAFLRRVISTYDDDDDESVFLILCGERRESANSCLAIKLSSGT